MICSRPVAVGFSTTTESEVALRWAVDEAVRRGRSLHVVTTYRGTEPTVASGHPAAATPPRPPLELRHAHDRALDYARGRLEVDRVSGDLHAGAPVPVLRRAGLAADLLVVGTRERSRTHSVSRAVAAYATCPVLVTPATASPPRSRILVGVDGSREADHALAFAFEEADLRGATVEAVHCWRPYGPAAGYRSWIANTEQNLREQVSASVTPFREKYANVEVVERILEGAPADELARRSASAALVIVGSRGRGRVVGSPLGSVTQALLDQARCPVAVLKSHR